MTKRRTFGAIAVVAMLLVLALLWAPTGLGRLIGDLWVTVMGVVVGLLGGAIGH